MTVDFKLHHSQLEVALDTSRFKVLAAGRRFGKSTLSLALAIKHCLDKPGSKVWIVCPTYSQSKDIYWRSLEKIPFWISELTKRGLKINKNDSELFLEFPNKSILQLKGSDREDTLRGSGLGFVIVDEAASMKPNVWTEILQPSLLDSNGNALFIGTPKGFNWFYDLWLKGMQKDKGWKSWKFTSYENPKLNKTVIEQAKEDSDSDTFAQEYLSEFRKYSGLVYPEFDNKVHVIEPIPLTNEYTYAIGIDRGLTNPTGCVFCAIDYNENVYVYNEIYIRNSPTDKLVELIKQKQGDHYITYTYCDPAAADFIATSISLGLTVSPAPKTGALDQWVLNGISVVKSKLKIHEGTGKPKLFIFKHCTNLITEFQQYRWMQRTSKDQQSEPDRPDKQYGFDHLLDALRYLLNSYKNNDTFDIEEWEFQQKEEMDRINKI
jgi:hypothetical protein